MPQPSYQGRFIWQELLCTDTGAAVNFYTRILPWKAQPFSPGSPYTMFMSRAGRPVAGAMSLSDEARAQGTPAHWRGYIGAGDVDAVLAQAVRLGAGVLQPAQDMPGVGRVALLADPEGATFGLYRPLSDSGGSGAGDGGFSWCELAARQRETALAFYQQLFSWNLKPPMDMGNGMQYQTFGLGGQDFGGAYTIPADRPMPPAWCPYASCSSADEVARRLVAAGGAIIHGPATVPGGGRIVMFFDPQHAMCAVHSMASAATQPAAAASAPKPKPPAAAAAAKKKPARKAARKPAAKPARKQPRKKAAAKAARRPAKGRKPKPARKSARRPARKVGRKSARKPIRKAARKPARKRSRKPARKK